MKPTVPALAALLAAGVLWMLLPTSHPEPAATEAVEPATAASAALAAARVQASAAAPPASAEGSDPRPAPAQGPDAQVLGALARQVAASERFAAHQLQLVASRCEAGSCSLDFSIPPFMPAAMRRDPRVAADLLQALQEQHTDASSDVGLALLDHRPDGMHIGLSISPRRQQTLSDTDIAKLRAQTLQDQLKPAKP